MSTKVETGKQGSVIAYTLLLLPEIHADRKHFCFQRVDCILQSPGNMINYAYSNKVHRGETEDTNQKNRHQSKMSTSNPTPANGPY